MKPQRPVDLRSWQGLHKWSMEHLDPQGDPSLSMFHGKSADEIQADVDFIQRAMKESTVDIGQRLKELLGKLSASDISRKDMMVTILQIEELVENLDFADLFSRMKGLDHLYEKIIVNPAFEWEDIQVLSLKIIGVCLFNTKMLEFDLLKVYDPLMKFLLKYRRGNADFTRALLFALTSLVSTDSQSCDEFSRRVVKSNVPLLLSVLRGNDAFNVRQKVLHCLLQLFIAEKRRQSDLLAVTLAKLRFPEVLKKELRVHAEAGSEDPMSRVLFERFAQIGCEMLDSKSDEVIGAFRDISFGEELSLYRKKFAGEEDWEDVMKILGQYPDDL